MKITHRVKNVKHYLEKTVVVRLQHKMVQHIINASMMTGLEYNTIATLNLPALSQISSSTSSVVILRPRYRDSSSF